MMTLTKGGDSIQPWGSLWWIWTKPRPYGTPGCQGCQDGYRVSKLSVQPEGCPIPSELLNSPWPREVKWVLCTCLCMTPGFPGICWRITNMTIWWESNMASRYLRKHLSRQCKLKFSMGRNRLLNCCCPQHLGWQLATVQPARSSKSSL